MVNLSFMGWSNGRTSFNLIGDGDAQKSGCVFLLLEAPMMARSTTVPYITVDMEERKENVFATVRKW